MKSETNSNGQTHNQGRENRQVRNIAYGLPLGIGTGVALGLTFDNLALGIAIGAVVFTVIGMGMNPSRMSAAELDTGTPGGRWIAVIAIGGVVLLAAGAILLFFLMR